MKRKSMNRKGISPLIATILLIAFAVALGSVVYTYFILLVDGGDALQGCARFISLSSTPDRAGEYVYDYDATSGIRISIFNNGPSELKAITYVVEGTKEHLSAEKQPITLSPGTSSWFTIPYDMNEYGSIMRIVLTPHYQNTGELRVCNEGRLEVIKQRAGY
jgi:flagellin-like protein